MERIENVNKITLLDFLNSAEESIEKEIEEVKESGEIVLENCSKHELLSHLKELLKDIDPSSWYGESWNVNYTKERANRYWLTISKFQLSLRGKLWNIVHTYDALRVKGTYESCELCGHHPCRFMYVISPLSAEEFEKRVNAYKMILTPEELREEIKKFSLTIGDECVLNYVSEKERRFIKSFRNVQQKIFNYEIIGDLTSRLYALRKAKNDQIESGEYFLLRDVIITLSRGDIPTKEDLIKTIKITKRLLGGESNGN